MQTKIREYFAAIKWWEKAAFLLVSGLVVFRSAQSAAPPANPLAPAPEKTPAAAVTRTDLGYMTAASMQLPADSDRRSDSPRITQSRGAGTSRSVLGDSSEPVPANEGPLQRLVPARDPITEAPLETADELLQPVLESVPEVTRPLTNLPGL